ncbi:MAG TPA: hypothetical protein VE983_09250, partial [Solirubrobacteraceae bacterium]|nr:hypothetical protein [Solirubrobacteraceae bacterium]
MRIGSGAGVSGRKILRRTIGGGAAVTLLLSGLALAHAPAISLSAPSSVTAGSPFKVSVKGYFNCTHQNFHSYKCSDIAEVDEVMGAITCPAHKFPKGGQAI